MYRANILVDSAWTAKIADFGFSIEIPHVCHGYTIFKSTLEIRSQGYIAPEVMNGLISDRSDVYSYGIVSIVAIFNNISDIILP
jgi:serine/threonine protein kinase